MVFFLLCRIRLSTVAVFQCFIACNLPLLLQFIVVYSILMADYSDAMFLQTRAKTAEPIEMLFGLWDQMGCRNHVLDGSP